MHHQPRQTSAEFTPRRFPNNSRYRRNRNHSHDSKARDQHGYGQYEKPDAWKTWGKTRTELEAAKREEERMRVPVVDNFEPGTLQTHFGASGRGSGGTRRHGAGGGFVLPPRPPDAREDTHKRPDLDIDSISKLDLNDTASGEAARNRDDATSKTGDALSGGCMSGSQSSVTMGEVKAQQQYSLHSSACEEDYPEWHQPYRSKKVKKELKKRDRLEWCALAPDERRSEVRQSESSLLTGSVTGLDLMAFAKEKKKKKKRKKGGDQIPARTQHETENSKKDVSYNDSSESDAPVPSAFAYAQLEDDTTTEGSSSLPPTRVTSVATKHSPHLLVEFSTTTPQFESYQLVHAPPPLPAPHISPESPQLKPPCPVGRPPSPSRFAKSRPIVTDVTEHGVVTIPSRTLNNSSANVIQCTSETGISGLSVKCHEGPNNAANMSVPKLSAAYHTDGSVGMLTRAEEVVREKADREGKERGRYEEDLRKQTVEEEDMISLL